uniref:Uncharacterized protein n=1 Tax=Arundo donax TaxID=35708 RepID=A0A0A9CNR0_ARUDO
MKRHRARLDGYNTPLNLATPQLQRKAQVFGCRHGLGTPKSYHRALVHFCCRSSPKVWRMICPPHFWHGRSCGAASCGGPNAPIV